MTKSPLSGAFADSSATTKKKSKKNGAILLISGIALATSIGGVFAANSITINGGDAIEFGQGAATTTSCEEGIDVAINQDLASTGTEFVVRNVVLSGIDAEACTGEGLEVSLVDSEAAVITSTTFRDPATDITWTIAPELTVDAGTVDRVAITTTN